MTSTRAVVGSCLLAMVACATGTAGPGPGVGHVVAAENVWGSIAAQLGGSKVTVTSIVRNPNADPHDYEPTAADARIVATAGVVIRNGIGYDPWIERLIDANPSPRRTDLDVGAVVGVAAGGNPHQWYSPPAVLRVVDAITAAYEHRDPADAAYFDELHQSFVGVALKDYRDTIEAIRARDAGAAIGASESMFALLAPALGLRLITPASFLKAIGEGTDPTAGDASTIDRQIATHEIAVYIYNVQNATPDVQRQVAACRRNGIPVVTFTETLVPATATFQSWQVAQLRALQTALTNANGRKG